MPAFCSSTARPVSALPRRCRNIQTICCSQILTWILVYRVCRPPLASWKLTLPGERICPGLVPFPESRHGGGLQPLAGRSASGGERYGGDDQRSAVPNSGAVGRR